MNVNRSFARFAQSVSSTTGKSWVFLLAVISVVAWAATGPIFHFSETWQLVINTGTTIITFLMVFLIQSTQNRDTAAMHIKLDEIIRALDGAQNRLMQLEDADEEIVQKVKAQYNVAAKRARDGKADLTTESIADAVSQCMQEQA